MRPPYRTLNPNHLPPSQTEAVGHQCRPKGYLSTHPGASRLQEVSENRVQGKIFPFMTLPFGQASAPYFFTRVVTSVATAVHSISPVPPFLNDWLNQAISPHRQGRRLTAYSTDQGTGMEPKLGVIRAHPQTFIFIGMLCNLQQGKVFPPKDRLEYTEGH